MTLPAGFVLEDDNGGLPPGFVLDRRAQPEQPQEPSLMDRAREFGSDARAVAGEFAAGVNRNLAGFADFVGPDSVNAALRLAGSDKQVPTLTGALAPTGIQGGFMEPGTARDVVAAAGSTLPAAGGLMQVPRSLATAGGALAEFAGLGTAKASSAIPAAASVVDQKLALLRNTGDASVAGKMLDSAGNVVKDPLQKAAQWQGFDPGFTAYVASAGPDTRGKMSAMLDIVDQTKKNWRSGLDARPLDVLGDSILNRIKVAREANRVAAVRLDGVADSLRGAQVDVAPAVDKFVNTLTEMGMQYNPQTGNLMLIQGSKTQDMPKVHKQAMAVLERLNKTRQEGKLDAYDVHVMKGWIDNFVDYGKSGKGKKGMIRSLENAVKGLRHDLDGALDSQFPQYNKINTQYAETRGELDKVYELAGSKFDPNDNSAALTLGSLSRRFLSNAQSNGRLRDSVASLDAVARKYITPGTDLVPYKPIQHRSGVTPAMLENDDLIGLAGYADELDRHFGAASKTSLFGDVDKAVQRGIEAGAGQMTAAGMVAEGGKWAWKKLARQNEEQAMKAMRELLNRGGK